MAVTLEDIAQKAGVSRSTVSRALNGQGRMTDETRAYIKSLADEMGYFPNFLAQSLHDTKTHMIGVVITTVSDPFIWEVIEGIEQVADNAGYTIFLGASNFDPEKEIETIVRFYQRRVDGIIVQTAHLSSLNGPRLEQLDIPIVLINDEEDVRIYPNVTIDEKKEVKKAIGYLFSIGHHRIGYIGSAARPLSNKRRLEGYKKAYRNSQLEFDETHIFNIGRMSDYETGYKAFDRILDTDVTAVFCYNDMIAIGLMNACRERGVNVPDDLSVVGFDDIEQASQFFPKLTTIHQPKFELGKRAMQLIQSETNEATSEILECKLIVRESTKPLA